MDVQFRKRGAPVALALAFALVASACSAGGSPSPSSPPSASPLASASASPSIDPTLPYTSKSGTLPSVKIAQSTPVLAFAPFIVAQDMNFFGYQGVKLEFIQLQGGTTALQALQSGNIDLVDAASATVAAAVAQGIDLQAIQNTIMMTLQLCVRKDWAQQHNVTADSTLQQKMAAMKGSTIGVTSPGDITSLGARFLLKKYGSLNPDTDATIVAVAGASAAAIQAAFDANQVQAFLFSPPTCSATKNGMVLVEPAQVPEFQNYTHEILYGSKKWLAAHKDIATAAATAVSMGNNFILKYPAAALVLLKKDFPSVDPSVIETSFNNTIKPQIKPDGKFDASMWQNTNQVLLDEGAIKQAVDTTDGSIWTNQYIGDASVR